jgi:hypothetical protein
MRVSQNFLNFLTQTLQHVELDVVIGHTKMHGMLDLQARSTI